MNQNSKTGWIVAGVLAVVVVILLVMMWNDAKQRDLGAVLEEGQENIVDVRAEVAEKCQGPEANEEECQEALADLAEVLREFSEDVNTASSTAPAAQ